MQHKAICKLLGRRLRGRRRILELTQTQVARRCGLSFQQIQKYEAGLVDLPVSRLILLADALSMSLPEVLAGLPSGLGANDDTAEARRERATPEWREAQAAV